VPIIRRDTCVYVPLGTCHSVRMTVIHKYQVSHRHSYIAWWWAHSRPKRVEKRNKHTKKNCAPSWLYLQDYTRMHSQQNIKKPTVEFAVELGSGLLTVPCLWLLNNVFQWPEVLLCVCVCVCNIIQSFPVVFYVVRAMHKFDFGLVTNETPNKLRPVKRRSSRDRNTCF
jgi:hypothetical protein